MTTPDSAPPEAHTSELHPVGRKTDLDLSIITPVYNEEDSIEPLCAALLDTLDGMAVKFEIICVDDGSSDASLQRLREQAGRRPEIKVISFRRNRGQTAAISAGLDHASGRVIVSIDADLQNDPADIPRLLEKLEEGYDVVSGWRKDRQDEALRRNLPSRIANRLISRISGVALHDYGCTLKAYRQDVVKGIRLYGEMHRFIPIYASWMGAKVCELPVRHHARKYGRSKYGLERIFKVLLDLLVVRFLDRYFVKPIYVFGGFGFLSLAISATAGLAALYLRIFEEISLIQTPLPLLSAIAFLFGGIAVLMGLLAEMLVRTYFESQGRPVYQVRELINFDRI